MKSNNIAQDKKVWFVTGSANGLGRNIVEAALKAGHRVIATARNTMALTDLAKQYGEDILLATLDVTHEQQAHEVTSLLHSKNTLAIHRVS